MASAALRKRPRRFSDRRLLGKLGTSRSRGRHRSKRQNMWHHLREWIWPSMGWGAYFRLYEIQLHRATGTAHKVSLGLAVGVATVFMPMLFQSLFALTLAWMVRGNLVAAVIGSLLGNPWTFPLLWGWAFWLGQQILGIDPEPSHGISTELVMQIFHHPFEVWEMFLKPTIIGAIPSGLVAGTLVYALMYRNIRLMQQARKMWLEHRRQDELVKHYRLKIRERMEVPHKHTPMERKQRT